MSHNTDKHYQNTLQLLRFYLSSINFPNLLRPRLHEQIKPPLIDQILDLYEVTPGKFAQIKVVLFAHVNAA